MENNQKNSVFISGNIDLNEKLFIQYYMPYLTELVKDENTYFNISDDSGCSEMVQVLLDKTVTDKSRINIFCIGEYPRIKVSEESVCFWGFKTLEERNAAMTLSSNLDLHIIFPGKGKSMVEKNLNRRYSPHYDYFKHYVNGNTQFWQMFFNAEELKDEKES